MPQELDWETGDGLIGIRDPAEVDAAFDRGERYVGTAVVGLVLNSDDVAVVAPRVLRALHSSDATVRSPGFVAAGDMARLFGTLTPEIYAELRTEGLGGVADTAIKDAMTFVPFWELPWWLRGMCLRLRLRNRAEGRLLALQDLAERATDAVKAVMGKKNL
ncbi:hypothetical protein [Streptomyces sp. YGL11-2]|uniref:hypothetical protein n=1 Tax=Streptomyces sp. YGL11-2 TaxID=3414028 RepID=UPI003CF6B899